MHVLSQTQEEYGLTLAFQTLQDVSTIWMPAKVLITSALYSFQLYNLVHEICDQIDVRKNGSKLINQWVTDRNFQSTDCKKILSYPELERKDVRS